MNKTKYLSGLLAILGIATSSLHAAETDARFDIVRFQVDGNSLLPQAKVEELVTPFVGRRKVYGDIQRALESLEGEYRRRGFGTVQVHVPEQELTGGVVKIQVSEAVVGKVEIVGNAFHDAGNIRASLPQLKEGTAPNMRQLSENVQLANENPSKKLELTFGVGEKDDTVDARIEVKDEDSDRYFLTLDNTGSQTSGVHRVGLSYQNANLMNLDHTLTLAYITALDPPAGVKVDIFSAGYRLPIYGLGDSIDVIYANSSTNTPSNVLAPGGTLGITGKGEVFALRYNLILPRQGEYSSKIVGGLDYKHINATCTVLGSPVAPGTAGCTPYTLRPISLTYSGQWQKPGEAIDFNIGGIYHAFPMGARYPYTAPAFKVAGTDRYTLVTGRPTSDQFAALRFGGSYTSALPEEWMMRMALSGQHARNALPAGEQIGLAGSTAVRGLTERAVAADRGYVTNIEVYTPNYAGKLGLTGDLKGLAFYDFAAGHNIDVAGASTVNTHIASIGIGLRYNLNKDVAAKFDLARVLDNHQATAGGPEMAKPRIRGHFSLAYGF